MNRRLVLKVMAVGMILAVFALSSAGLAAPKLILKLAHADAVDITTSRKHAQCITFANLVNAQSGGRLEVQVFGAGQLGAEREYVEAVQAGTVQAGIASGVIGSFFPPAMMTDIPYLFPTATVAWKVLDGPFGQKLSDMFLARTGMRNLAFAEVGFRHFTNSKRPIKSPADIKGLKIRVQETQVYLRLINSMGGSPTPVAWTETYTALQTKVVDGQENPISSIVFAKLYEVQKYLTLDGHVYGVDWFVINEKFFQSLDKDLQ
ncbi:MAG TPA: DctP family TRAP transporter solute-binding subunit, partial [Bacillota bacterium]|nr:DctP family TRAP transporter solute-binding subunit [Bacillota bacterium]